MWGEAWGRAVLVDAAPRWLGAALVKMAPVATFPWVEERHRTWWHDGVRVSLCIPSTAQAAD